MEEIIKCEKCGKGMESLGNVSGVVYASYPEQWYDVYVCDGCKTKKTIRRIGTMYDVTGGRNLDEYSE